MTLPHPDRRRPAPHQRARLARWLHEWRLFCALGTDTCAPSPADGAPWAPRAMDTGAESIRPGDIRLLHPDCEPDDVRYVAVAVRQGRGGMLVIPFGLFSEPATPQEVITGRAAPALRVLCPWNRFVLTVATLQRCWLADRLSPEEYSRLIGPLTGVDSEAGGASWRADEVGPPLQHPLDPRWDYLEMESLFRSRVSRFGRNGAIYDISAATEGLKAAEDRPPYGDDGSD